MVATDFGREAMQRRERLQENVRRELGRGIVIVGRPECGARRLWCGPPSFVGVTLYELLFVSKDALRCYSCRRFDFKSSRADRNKVGKA